MKKFSEYIAPVSSALVAQSLKEDQEADAKKFQALLEKFGVAKFTALSGDDQSTFITELSGVPVNEMFGFGGKKMKFEIEFGNGKKEEVEAKSYADAEKEGWKISDSLISNITVKH
jgi:hypothetical protein